MTRAELLAVVRATGCAVECGERVFLCDPESREWVKSELARSNFEVRGELPGAESSAIGIRHSAISSGWLCIRTGGSSGAVKFARHDEQTVSAAVRGFCSHFELERVNAVDVLPPYHVSGFMARVRCAATGGEHRAWEWKKLEAGETPALREADWVISLVPTQLQRLLANRATVEWLRRFRIIFIGGGPMWPELAEAAAKAELRVALTYGMTETAAMATALRPEQFLAGVRSCGTALPHARLRIDESGVIRVRGESVFYGYLTTEIGSGLSGKFHLLSETCRAPRRGGGCHPLDDNRDLSGGAGREDVVAALADTKEFSGMREFVTEDLGRIDERGHLHVLGRRDAVIITGGKKVQPEIVEAALRASGEFADVAVIGVPDLEWGEVVVACYVRGEGEPDFVKAAIGLAGHERPKRFVSVAVEAWPRNAQGKLNRAELARCIATA